MIGQLLLSLPPPPRVKRTSRVVLKAPFHRGLFSFRSRPRPLPSPVVERAGSLPAAPPDGRNPPIVDRTGGLL